MNKNIPVLLLVVLVAASVLLLVYAISLTATTLPSPFLIAATIVASVALFGALFSLFIEKRSRQRTPQERNILRKR